jgi:hypothetical protein
MFTTDTLAAKTGAILIEKAERRLEPRALQTQLLQRAIVETAAANFPAANLGILKHGFRSFEHPAFHTAIERMKISCRGKGDAFEMIRGVYAAIVLAGYGLPVAPFDLKGMRILAKPSNDIDTVLARPLFAR